MEQKQDPLDNDAWNEALEFLDRLRRNYEESDPSKTCEHDRLELAHQSIRCFWEIYRRYLVWAQTLIAGRYMLNESSALQDAIEPLIDQDREDIDYIYECVGNVYQFNRNRAEEFENGLHISLATEGVGEHLTYSQQRRLFSDMCNTHCADAWWAKDIQHGLETVDLGGRVDLFEPPKGGRGKPASLFYARFRAVRYVCYLHGKGGNKLLARLEVGEEIGASEATLRYWEKSIRREEVADYRLDCAFFAGEYESSLSKPQSQLSDDEKELLEIAAAQSFKMTTLLENAKRILAEIQRETLDQIRDRISEASRTQ